jgi:hypothetical protein
VDAPDRAVHRRAAHRALAHQARVHARTERDKSARLQPNEKEDHPGLDDQTLGDIVTLVNTEETPVLTAGEFLDLIPIL